jgi:hypothetical protein
MRDRVTLAMQGRKKSSDARDFAVRQQGAEFATLGGRYFQWKKYDATALGAIGNEPPAPLLDQRFAQRLIPDARRGSSVLSESAL